MNVVPDPNAQLWRRLRFNRQAAEILAYVAVEMTPETVRAQFLPGAPFTVENLKVLRRPVDLRARTL
jgi:hypothetical protein